MLFGTEALGLDDYKYIMEQKASNHPLPLLIDRVEDILFSTHNFRESLFAVLDKIRNLISDEDKVFLEMVGQQPQFYLRGQTEESDMYAFGMPEGWNYTYFSQLLGITGVTLEETLNGLVTAHPEIETQPGLLAAVNSMWLDYGKMRGCLSDMYRALNLATDYDRQLREDGSEEAANTGRDIVRRMMNTLTGYMKAPRKSGRRIDAISAGISPPVSSVYG